MGSLVTTAFTSTLEATVYPSLLRSIGLPLKRKHQPSENGSLRKKRLLTCDHVDKKRLEQEKPADIQISGLGKVWNLHKSILRQSPYFNCMFNGKWRESSQSVINIKFPDESITKEGELYLLDLFPKWTIPSNSTWQLLWKSLLGWNRNRWEQCLVLTSDCFNVSNGRYDF